LTHQLVTTATIMVQGVQVDLFGNVIGQWQGAKHRFDTKYPMYSKESIKKQVLTKEKLYQEYMNAVAWSFRALVK